MRQLNDLHLELSSRLSPIPEAAPFQPIEPTFILHHQFASGQSRVALCGLGGVGKSQIALEYAFRLKEKSPQTSIFWVYISAGVNFEEAYGKITKVCTNQDQDEKSGNTLQRVKNWLESNYPLKYLMIIDNVDSAEAFFVERLHGKPLADYVPQSGNGSVLYTSRNRDIGVDLTFDRDRIMIPSMDPEDALQLFGQDLINSSNVEEQHDLFHELDYLPLAITQVVAYMSKRRKSIRQYLSLFRQTDSVKIRLLKHQFSDHGRESRQMESLGTTFMVTFECLRNEHPNAARLLATMSFLDRQNIEGYLLHSDEDNAIDTEEPIELLMAFSFVKKAQAPPRNGFEHEIDRAVFSVRRLVQLATRAWLEEDEIERNETLTSRVRDFDQAGRMLSQDSG